MSDASIIDIQEGQLESINLVVLMITMVAWLVLTPLVVGHPWMSAVHLVVFYSMLALTFNVTLHGRRTRRFVFAGLVLLAVADVISELRQFHPDTPGARFLSWLATFYMLFAPVLLTVAVLRAKRVTMNVVFGALCAYFVMGMFWAVLFNRIASVSSEVFRFPVEQGYAQPLDIIYFSFTTLTTLGYGDITPQTPLLRILATMEAFIGQIYLVVLVARLVSLQIAQRDG